MMASIEELQQEISEFCAERDWDQFHDLKNLAIALNVESGELLEAFLWKEADDVKREKLQEELADVLIYVLRFAEKAHLDISEIVRKKLAVNREKYPVGLAKGNATKYTEFKKC